MALRACADSERVIDNIIDITKNGVSRKNILIKVFINKFTIILVPE